VSFRLHATLPAIAYGTRTVNIAYDERAECLIQDLGIEEASLNLVRLGSSFGDALTTQVSVGGYVPSDQPQVAAAWDSKVQFQLDALRRFRSLVSDYMNQGTVGE
jgi:hypothetical protein